MKTKVKTAKLPKSKRVTTETAPKPATLAEGVGELKYVLHKQVRPDPDQPRKTFDKDKLQELADSIKAVGIRQAIQVEWVNGLELLEPDLVEKDWCVKTSKATKTFANEAQAREFMAKEAGTAEGYFKIIDGERRWRAAELAGVERVKVEVVDTSSPEWAKQKLSVQLVLNQQHENVTALEEAAAYQKEIDSGRHTPETLYQQLGISRGSLFSRLALNRVDKRVREALLAGNINTSVAGLLAVVPSDKIEEVLEDVAADEDYGNAAMPFREVQDLIERRYAAQLKSAVFDVKDAELLPEQWGAFIDEKRTVKWEGRPEGVVLTPGLRAHTGDRTDDDGMGHKKTVWGVWSGQPFSGGQQIANELNKPDAQALADYINHGNAGLLRRVRGGACTDCPYRSGNLESGGLKNPNVCTLPGCFAEKTKRARAAILEEAEEKGKTVLPAKRTGNLFSSYGGPSELAYNAPFLKPTQKCDADKKGRTYKELVGETVPTVHALNEEGTLVALMDKKAVAAALKEKGIKVEQQQTTSDWQERDRKRKEKAKQLEAAAAPALEEVLEKVKSDKDELRFLRTVATEICNDYNFMQARNWKNTAGMKSAVGKMDATELRVAIVQAIASETVDDWAGEFRKDFKELCEAYGVDLKKHVAGQKELPNLKEKKKEDK